jgi:Cu(I)/Ag(I) efflux system membrane fusion protein
MKSLALKLAIVVLMVAAAGSAYVYRSAWLSYLPGGQGPPDGAIDPTPAGTREDPFIGHGVLEEIRMDEGQLVLRHDEIPGLMGAMTMGFPVSGDVPLDSLTVGEEVEFRIERRDTGTGPVHEVFSVRPETAGMTMEAGDDRAVFTVDPGRQQLIGVRTSPVGYETIDRTLRTIGTVALDETRMSEVHPRVTGWIEETFVNFQYQHVERGDPLFTLYSPELVATQEEYLLALRGLETLGTSSFPSARFGAEDLVRAARRRLELWDITPEQIAGLEETREPVRAMTIHSPATGHVMVRNAFAGQRVGPETMLYQIADHSIVWVRGAVYENEMAWVETGQTAVMRVPALPGREFTGRLTFIDPHVDARTRTLSVRLEFPNSDLALKPGMYADLEIGAPSGERGRRLLMVPESAVLPTGVRNIVFVDQGEGRMEIRNVELGSRVGDRYEVLAGLQEGERVVTSGNFLIDAESRLQAAEPVWQGGEQP